MDLSIRFFRSFQVWDNLLAQMIICRVFAVDFGRDSYYIVVIKLNVQLHFLRRNLSVLKSDKLLTRISQTSGISVILKIPYNGDGNKLLPK